MWLTAWERYAIACAMVGQMDFADAMRHKSVVTEVACSALKEGKRSLLGVLYDEVARQVKTRFQYIAVRRFSFPFGRSARRNWAPPFDCRSKLAAFMRIFCDEAICSTRAFLVTMSLPKPVLPMNPAAQQEPPRDLGTRLTAGRATAGTNLGAANPALANLVVDVTCLHPSPLHAISVFCRQ